MREVETKTEELKQWAEAQSRRDPDDMDAVLEPFDHISSQLVRLSAEQHAAEDLIDCLEKALLNGAIDLPTMLKETRRLASQQFLARMHVMKINASLQQALQNGH
jgi:ESCRT-I complex subunit TSG101